VKPKQPPGPPMTLGNMRALGVQNLIASCLNEACRHTAFIDVSSHPADTDVPSFGRRAVCGKCVDVRPARRTRNGELGEKHMRLQ
jgi:hypothetical protein